MPAPWAQGASAPFPPCPPRSGTTQLASLLSWSALPPSERFQRLLSIAYCAALVAVPLLAPATYLRWRQPFLILYRLGYFLFPLLRKPAGTWGGGGAGT